MKTIKEAFPPSVILIFAFLMASCAGVHRYYPPKRGEQIKEEKFVYPNRPPHNYEIRHIERLKKQGDREKLRKYLERISKREG